MLVPLLENVLRTGEPVANLDIGWLFGRKRLGGLHERKYPGFES